MADLWSKVRAKLPLLTGEEVEEPEPETASLLAQLRSTIDESTTLNRTQRAIGFAFCLGVSLLFTMLAGLSLFPFLNLKRFALSYTFANAFSIGSTCFLVGPLAQAQRMFDKGRWVATSIYLVALVATLIAAFVVGNALLVLVCFVFQMGAYLWYCLSYIPFARHVVGRFVSWFTREG